MDNTQEQSIDDILKVIRLAITNKESNVYFQSFMPKKTQEEVFLLSKNMLVKREDIPYKSGMWNFDDVAKKMMKKYNGYFTRRNMINSAVRVRVKEDVAA